MFILSQKEGRVIRLHCWEEEVGAADASLPGSSSRLSRRGAGLDQFVLTQWPLGRVPANARILHRKLAPTDSDDPGQVAHLLPPAGRPTASSATHPRHGALAALAAHTHPAGMFVVTEAEAAAIRAVYEQSGEFSAAVELRRLFPSITDTAQARACARTIAGWKPLPVPPRPVPRLRPRGRDTTPPA